MLAQLLRTSPAPISAIALIAGFILIASGRLPLGLAGAVLIMVAFLVPFLRLGVTPRPHAASGPLGKRDGRDAPALAQPGPMPVIPDAVDEYVSAFAAARERRTITDVVRAERALATLRHAQGRLSDPPAGSAAMAHMVPDLTSDVLDRLELELADLKADIWADSARPRRAAEPVMIDG